jgi:hypothetical protein
MSGWGWGGFSHVPKPEPYLYQKSLVDAGRAVLTSLRDLYANNANSYLNQLRDNDCLEHYSIVRREALHYRNGGIPKNFCDCLKVALKTPNLPTATFYSPEGKIIWPADAPMAGEFRAQLAALERVCQAVLDEVTNDLVGRLPR